MLFICLVSLSTLFVSSCMMISETKTPTDETKYFFPNVSLNFDLYDNDGILTDSKQICNTDNFTMHIENYSNFDIDMYVFVTINCTPVAYILNSSTYDSYDKMGMFSLNMNEIIDLTLTPNYDINDLQYSENFLDITLIAKNRRDLPDNSITSNVYFAMNNRYSISNDMSERSISLLKEKFSVSESHEIKYDSKNAYCLLMNEIETDNLYQDDELNNKFYGVFSDTADDEFFGIYIFDGEKLASTNRNSLLINIKKSQVAVEEFHIENYSNDAVFCLKLPFFGAKHNFQFIEHSAPRYK